MGKIAGDLEDFWHSRLLADYPEQPQKERESIVSWLLGENCDALDSLPHQELAVVKQGIDYRYRILRQRYLGVSPTQAYKTLINRLGSPIVLRQKITTWVALSRDRRRAITDVLQEVIQEMLHSDRYLQGQLNWIAQCTAHERLRNTLLFATLEEYCLRPIRNQPLLTYRFLNFLKRSQRGGMTQVPQKQILQAISAETTEPESDRSLSLLDAEANRQYEELQEQEEQQSLRQQVKGEFTAYLQEKVGPEAVAWLKLYLKGSSQEEIANCLNLPVKQVYRLREKVGYHAVRAFALKGKSDLVAQWLEISLKEHNFGLTPHQWQTYTQNLTPIQQEILAQLQQGKSLAGIAESRNCKKSQVMNEWSQLYLKAQALRNS